MGLALASSQRAMVAAGIANLQKGDNQHKKEGPSIGGPSTDDAAKQMSVSPKSVERAKAVKEKGSPGLADMVRDGKVSAHIIATGLALETNSTFVAYRVPITQPGDYG